MTLRTRRQFRGKHEDAPQYVLAGSFACKDTNVGLHLVTAGGGQRALIVHPSEHHHLSCRRHRVDSPQCFDPGQKILASDMLEAERWLVGTNSIEHQREQKRPSLVIAANG